MKNWNAAHIEHLQKTKGLNVTFSDPVSKDRSVQVVRNGITETVKLRKEREHVEDDMQMNCVEVFRLMYPQHYYRLYHIPNGGKREKREAERLLKMGVVPGVLDLFLNIPKGKWAGLYLEAKTLTGRLSTYQIAFIKEVRDYYKVVVFRSVEQFLNEVNDYLKNK